MKKSKNLFVIIGIIAGLAIGFLIGISVNYPRFNNSKVSGTIGKVNNYRNTQVSEAAIELKNDLVSDTAKLKSLQNYLNYYYLATVKMAGDVDFAINEVSDVKAFKEGNMEKYSTLISYSTFLFSARTDLLVANLAFESPEKTEPIVLRNMLNNVNNIIVQLNYRDRVVLDFVDALALFIEDSKPQQFAGLEKAHDLLTLNELNAALITKNKVVLKFLDKSKLLSSSEEYSAAQWDQSQINDMIQQDFEKLQLISSGLRSNEALLKWSWDVEQLKRVADASTIGDVISDKELLNNSDLSEATMLGSKLIGSSAMSDASLKVIILLGRLSSIANSAQNLQLVYTDAESLGGLFDAESLGLFDAESLGSSFLPLINAMQTLNATFYDTEKIGFVLDTEKLGFFNSERLNCINDVEKMGAFDDAESLRFGFP